MRVHSKALRNSRVVIESDWATELTIRLKFIRPQRAGVKWKNDAYRDTLKG